MQPLAGMRVVHNGWPFLHTILKSYTSFQPVGLASGILPWAWYSASAMFK